MKGARTVGRIGKTVETDKAERNQQQSTPRIQRTGSPRTATQTTQSKSRVQLSTPTEPVTGNCRSRTAEGKEEENMANTQGKVVNER
jgi:hypothetical protein